MDNGPGAAKASRFPQILSNPIRVVSDPCQTKRPECCFPANDEVVELVQYLVAKYGQYMKTR